MSGPRPTRVTLMIGCAACGRVFEHDPRSGSVRCDECRESLEDYDVLTVTEATCDLCRLDWPLDDLDLVEWTDTAGEVWERAFCARCRQREYLT